MTKSSNGTTYTAAIEVPNDVDRYLISNVAYGSQLKVELDGAAVFAVALIPAYILSRTR